jgi:hypothetical protein
LTAPLSEAPDRFRDSGLRRTVPSRRAKLGDEPAPIPARLREVERAIDVRLA